MGYLLETAVHRNQDKDKNGKYLVSGIQSTVWAKMALYANDNNPDKPFFTSINNLVSELKFSKTAIKESIKFLLKTKRIILFKKGNSKAHKANEYRINLDMLQDNLTIKPPKYPKVNKSVDKALETPPPGSGDDIGAGSGDDIGGRALDDHQDHIKRSYKKIPMKGEQQDDPLKGETLFELKKLGFYDKEAIKAVKTHGVHKVYAAIREVSNLSKSGKKRIDNPGAYVRFILEEIENDKR